MTVFGEKNNVLELYKSVLGPFLTSLSLSSPQIDYLKRFKKNSVDSICASIIYLLRFMNLKFLIIIINFSNKLRTQYYHQYQRIEDST